ncbi:Pecanex-like protein 2 [Labeo rohita]|uniref:Pecanex-like protein 2 n=1 Tax=Labeo rohita TaxID=84645 RepID=A0ABQ8LDH7_LABRO|nr:Pecanex-like protein 2 [Labeo rohita]
MEGGAREDTEGSRVDQTEGGDRRDSGQEEPGKTQAAVMMVAHGGANRGGARGGDGEPMILGDIEDPEGQGRAQGSRD